MAQEEEVDFPATKSFSEQIQPTAEVVIDGKYTLVEPIGEGGMGTVWRAKQSEPIKRLVAVKLIKLGMDSRSVLSRFEAERQALALMDHPNIAKVFDGGLHDGRPFFVMELVRGIPITEYCDQKKLTLPQRLELFVSVCRAIQHAHQKGIIHRDIKPSNVLVTTYDDNPVVKVIDFGVAKATGGALTHETLDTGLGGVVGTPQYMSPEQAMLNNVDVDTRSDVYSLGVLLYELLSGDLPFSLQELKKKGVLEILRVVREEDPPRPSTKISTAGALPSISANRSIEPRKLTGLLRNELDWIVMKALEKDRGRRYETANGFAADVLRYLAGEPIEAHPPSVGYRIKKFVRRHRGEVVSAALLLLVLLGGIVGSSLGMFEARKQRDLAEQANKNLSLSLERETARFELAREAIRTYHGEISEDLLLKQSEFSELRARMLRGAAGFYDKLETLLKEKEDPKSQIALGQAYLELGRITSVIGDKAEALQVQERGLLLHRALATQRPDDIEIKQSLAESLYEIALLNGELGSLDEALALFDEGIAIVSNLTKANTDAAADLPIKLASLYVERGGLLSNSGRREEAIKAYQEALQSIEKFVTDNPRNLQARRERAVVHSNLGAVYLDTAQHTEALKEFELALQQREQLLRENPDDAKILKDIATNHSNIGAAQAYLGNPQKQLAAFQKANAILLKLYEGSPAITDNKRQLASGFDNVALVHLDLGELDKAQIELAKAIELQQEVVKNNPQVVEFRGHLARFHNNLGAVLGRTDMRKALLQFEQAKNVQEEIARDFPQLKRYQSELAQSHQNVGLANRAVGEYEAAIKEYEQAIAILKGLQISEPQVVNYQVSLAGNYQNIAMAQQLLGLMAESAEALNTAIEIQESVVERNPEVAHYQRELGRSLNNLAALNVTNNNLGEAERLYDRSQKIHSDLVATYPDVYDYRNGLGWTLSGFGRLLLDQENNKRAVEVFRRAIAEREKLSLLSPTSLYDTASNYGSLANLAKEASSGLTETDSEEFVRLGLDYLSKAVEAGFSDLKNLQEDNHFERLRDSDRYQEIVKALQERSK